MEKQNKSQELIPAVKELLFKNKTKEKKAEALTILGNKDLPEYKNDEEYNRHLAAIVDLSYDAIISKLLDGTITSWNKGSEKMFGYSSKQAVGKNISLIIPSEFLNQEKKIVEKIRNNEIIDHFETIRIKKGGQQFHVSLTISPLKDKAGSIIGASKIVRDITSRKKSEAELIQANKELAFQKEEKGKLATELILATFQKDEKEKIAVEKKEAEESLKKSEANLKAIFENTSEGFILTDRNGTIKSFNNKALNIIRLNIDKEISVGKSFYEFLPDSRKKMYTDVISKVLSGKTLQYDHSYIRKTEETKWFSFTINPVYNAELIEGISITTIDITERKLAEQQLKESELFNKGILASLSSHIAVIDNTGNIIAVNKAWDDFAKANGVDSLQDVSAGSNYIEVCQRSMASGDILAGQVLQGIQSVFNKTIKNFELEYPCHSLTEERWFNLSIMNFGEDDSRVVISHQNITKRKIAEVNSIQSEKHSRDLFEHSIIGLALARMDGTLVDVNKAYAKIIGRTIQETKKLNYWEITPEKYSEQENEILKELSNNGKFMNYEKEYIHKKGYLVPVRLSGNIIEKGGEKFIWSSIEDITEKKKLEKAIERERDQFFDIFLKAPSAIGMLKGADHVFEMVNPLYLQLIGKNDVIGKTVAEVLPEVIEQGFIDLLNTVYTTGKSYIGREVLIKIDKEGNGELTDAYLNLIYQAYRNHDGNIEGIFFFANDITEQIQSRKAIEKSEKFFKGVIENSDDMITMVDHTGKTLYASPAVSRKFGYTHEECLRLNIADIIHPDDAVKMQEFVMKIMMHPGVPMESPLIRDRKKDGTYIWVEGTLTNFLAAEGINAIVANFRDVTERKKAGELIVRSEANLTAIIENTEASIYSLDRDFRYITFNNILYNSMKQIYGLDIKPGDHIYDFLEKLNPLEASEWKKVYSKALTGEIVKFEKEFNIYDYQGYFDFSIHPIWENKNVIGLSCFALDITKQKKAAAEKTNLEELLKKTNNLARLGNWEVDTVKNTVYWSDITKQIHEVADDFVPDLETAINYYKAGSSREIITNAITEAMENDTPFDVELQIVTAKGNERWIRAIGEAECVDGKCIRLFGSFQDIDERKIAESEVLKVYEEKNIILESIKDGFFAVDTNWIITYWNNQSEKMLGKLKSEAVGKNLLEVYSHNIDTPFYTYFHKAVKENTVQHFEAYSEKLDVWYELSAYPSTNGLSVYFKDINERIKTQTERARITADLIQRNKDLEQFSYIVSHNLRAPVANIIGLSSMLQKEDLEDKLRNEINIGLSTSVSKLDYVIRDLNHILKVRQQVSENKQNVIFSHLVSDITLSIDSIIVDQKATIVCDFSEVNELFTVKSYLHSIFYNLISNSLKYRQPDIPPVIEIKSQKLNDRIILFFKDNGLGIDLQKRGDEVFGLYKRFHTKQAEGKGVGLYMVKTQVEAIGGKIFINSEVNKGTEFKIEFYC